MRHLKFFFMFCGKEQPSTSFTSNKRRPKDSKAGPPPLQTPWFERSIKINPSAEFSGETIEHVCPS